MLTSKVDLKEMLEARERRSFVQNGLLSEFGKPLVCLTMNIAGPVKRTPLIRLLFYHGLALFEESGFPILSKKVIDAPTGCEAFYSVDSDPQILKSTVCALEESFPAARLFDFDVIGADGEKLSRENARACIVCGGPVQICSRSRAHGLERICSETNLILAGFAADHYAGIAVDALIREVHTTPKPGLVDENNSGAHTDMDLPLFERSAHTLLPYFRKAVLNGIRNEGMAALREAGKEAERQMLTSTNGVNTHKGAIFSFGLMLSAIGNALITGEDVFERVSTLLASEERNVHAAPLTHGDSVRTAYGKIGAAEEAKAGFPSARFAAERLAAYRKQGAPNPGALVLCDLMARVEDTNVYHRGGREGAEFVRAEAARISALSFEKRLSELSRFDEEMIRRNLSAGGCADLLALSYLIDRRNTDSEYLFD